MNDDDDETRGPRPTDERANDNAAPIYSFIASPAVDRWIRALAEAREQCAPNMLGPLGHTADVLRDALLRGLQILACEYGMSGIDEPRESAEARLGAPLEGAAIESARLAREASIRRGKDPGGAMSTLAEAFPSLRGADGVRPWAPARLDRWLSSDAVTSGGRDAAAFVLEVWNPECDWSVRFDVHRALSIWDRAHRAAFLAWASAPWWP